MTMLTTAGTAGPSERGRNWWRLGCLAASGVVFTCVALVVTVDEQQAAGAARRASESLMRG